jgi:ADP-heptose:LPS heptosyltransferase
MFNTPVLFLVFNRPDVTRITFECLKEIKPSKLYVAADGPRSHKEGEAELCRQTREIVNGIDWPCEVKTLYREQNLGCGKAVSGAITWFFNEVEHGIIIEDDCLPNHSFFKYCEELLEKYKHNENVFHIGCVNFQEGNTRGDGDYYFSAIAHVWGWASWHRAWSKYKFDIPGVDKFISEDKLQNYFDSKVIKDHLYRTFSSIEKHETDTWDYQWTYCIYNHGGVSIIPNRNIVSNIGFGGSATHTTSVNQYANRVTEELKFPLKHPAEIKLNKEADLYFFKAVDKLFDHLKHEKKSLSYQVRNKIISGLESFLRKRVLPKIQRHPSNNILLVKPDAIGDMFICQWLFAYLDKYPDFKDHHFYLLANSRLKSYLDSAKLPFIKEIIYYDQSIHRRFKPLYGFYFGLRKYKFKKVYNLLYSRTKAVDEIVYYTGAPDKIGFDGDHANIKPGERTETDTHYTSLFKIKDDNHLILHESERLKMFFEHILKIKLDSFSAGYLKPFASPSKMVLVCPGSNEEYKKWNPVNYARLINSLSEKNPSFKFKIVCGPGEEYLGDIIKNNCKVAEVINVNDINKLVAYVNEASLVISNDSAPVHIAIAYGKPFVCIFNGSRYARFVPYTGIPDAIYCTVMPDGVETELKDETRKLFYHQHKVNVNINDIPVEKVVNACKIILNNV